MRLPTVNTIQSICAAPHGSNAKGTVKQNAVGRYTYRVTTWRTVAVSDERSTPRLIDAQHLTFLVWVSILNKASRRIVHHPEVDQSSRRGSLQDEAQQKEHHAPQQQQAQTIEPSPCHLEPRSKLEAIRNLGITPLTGLFRFVPESRSAGAMCTSPELSGLSDMAVAELCDT